MGYREGVLCGRFAARSGRHDRPRARVPLLVTARSTTRRPRPPTTRRRVAGGLRRRRPLRLVRPPALRRVPGAARALARALPGVRPPAPSRRSVRMSAPSSCSATAAATPAATEQFHEIVDAAARAPRRARATPAFMELAEPSLADAVAEAVAAGADEIVVQPCFLFDGNHIRRDIPEMLAGFAAELPGRRVPLRAAPRTRPARRRHPARARRGGRMPGLKPHEIEVRSMEIIDGLLPARRLVARASAPWSSASCIRAATRRWRRRCASPPAPSRPAWRPCAPARPCSPTRTWSRIGVNREPRRRRWAGRWSA